MNSESSFRFSSRRPQRGVALVIVLATLILLVGLIIAILSRVSAGRAVSSSYANGVACRVLVDTAVNTVIGQIHDATSDPTGTVGWASQPGAIRTYQGNNFVAGYKLFSSSAMKVASEADLVKQDTSGNGQTGIDTSWASKPGQYVNINKSVTKTVGTFTTTVYPILDKLLLAGSDPKSAGSNPISDNYVQGLSVADYTQPYQQNVEMPVEWIYQREDGTLTTGQYQADGTVRMADSSNSPKPTSPIKARMAFWTDDESSKINVNTASEGLYWDSPHTTTQLGTSAGVGAYLSNPSILTTSAQNETLYSYPAISTDQGLGYVPPARDEYNRFPGHPAMTSLSAAFPLLTPKQIFSIAPRISIDPNPVTNVGGGSRMGTASVVSSTTSIQAYSDGDRLYDSESEIALRNDDTSTPPRARTLNAGLTPDQVNKRRFVLTANSRAPELNLFGRPRVAMWPVSATNAPFNGSSTGPTGTRTPYDQLIAFCCTLNSTLTPDPTGPISGPTKWPFVFFRQNPYALLGGDANTTNGEGTDGFIPSNKDLFTYLHDVTSKQAPGFPSTLNTKYGDDCDQIITEMLDYIRCTNIFDQFLEGPLHDAEGTPSKGQEFTNGTYTPAYGKPGHGQVLPLRMLTSNGTVTSGLGRTPTVSQVALMFICTAAFDEGGRPKAGLTAPVWARPNNAGIPAGVVPASNDPGDPAKPGEYPGNITLFSPTGTPPRKLLVDGEKRVQAMLLVNLDTPMAGYPNLAPCVEVEITNADQFTVAGAYDGPSVLFPKPTNVRNPISLLSYDNNLAGYNKQGATYWQSLAASGNLGFFPFVLLAKYPGTSGRMRGDATTTVDGGSDLNLGGGGSKAIPNYFISDPFTIKDGTMAVSGAALKIKLYYPPDGIRVTTRQYYQTVNVTFPPMTMPVPKLDVYLAPTGPYYAKSFPAAEYTMSWTLAQENWLGRYVSKDSGPNDENKIAVQGGRFVQYRNDTFVPYIDGVNDFIRGTTAIPVDTVRSMELRDGDFRLTSTMPEVPDSFFVQTNKARPGDYLSHSLTSPYYVMSLGNGRSNFNIDMDKQNGRTASVGPNHLAGLSIGAVPSKVLPTQPIDLDYDPSPTSRRPYLTGDWDTGLAAQADGPFANLPDAGQLHQSASSPFPPYFWQADQDVSGVAKAFSPNRQIASSGMFGSLPTGNKHGAWRTLLFRPASSTPGTKTGTFSPHPAGADPLLPPDHLFMDLFWMPVVQPYAISEPFSTAGKINMNYQMLPFTYINRQTALYALMKAEKMLIIPDGQSTNYKSDGLTQTAPATWRLPIDPKATLVQFQSRFDDPLNPQIFRSASQICDLHLIPQDQSFSGPPPAVIPPTSMPQYWKSRRLTGDNLKERPYTNIYPRLTTQSNTYRVHYWVQSLKQINADPTIFVDPDSILTTTARRDVVTGQLRGSTIVERYLDANDTRFVNHPGDGVNTFGPMTDSLNPAYKMRVYGNAVFAP